jgi:hypothetical protein
MSSAIWKATKLLNARLCASANPCHLWLELVSGSGIKMRSASLLATIIAFGGLYLCLIKVGA